MYQEDVYKGESMIEFFIETKEYGLRIAINWNDDLSQAQGPSKQILDQEAQIGGIPGNAESPVFQALGRLANVIEKNGKLARIDRKSVV